MQKTGILFTCIPAKTDYFATSKTMSEARPLLNTVTPFMEMQIGIELR